MYNPFSYMSEKIISSLVWSEELSTARWCEENIYLGRLVTPYQGMMSFDRTPWIREILDDWDKTWIEQYNIMASTQVGKTTIEFCCITKELDTDPCMMSLAVASDKEIPGLLRKKINPFFEGIRTLQDKMQIYVSDEKKRTLDAIKQVPGGMWVILGNTEKNRKGDSVQKIFMDEVSLFAKGDVKEWIGRTKFYEKTGRKIFIISSRDHEEDEMEINYENSYCKKSLMIECQGCKEYFYPGSEHFVYMTEKEYKDINEIEIIENRNDYKREAILTAHVECECGHKTTSQGLEDLIRNKKVKLVVTEGSEDDTIYGYKLNALATGLTKYSTIAEALIEAGSDFTEINRIYKDYFNEIYKEDHASVASTDVVSLSNGYEEFIVPDDTIGLYMGVDSQKGYYWVTIIAIEYGIKSHLVWCGRVEDESTIEAFMDREYFHQDGTKYNQGIRRAYHDWQGYKTPKKEILTNDDTGEVIESTVLDMPQRVKEFALRMMEKYGANQDGLERYYAVRGEQFIANDEPFKYTTTSVIIPGYKEERKVKSLRINTTAMKSAFMSSLVRNIAKVNAKDEEDLAFSYEERLHFINETLADKLKNRKKAINTDYDRQITSETYTNHLNDKGKPSPYKYWDGNRDNHFLDTNSYIQVAIYQDNLTSMRKPIKTKEKFSIKNDLGI